MARLFEKNIFVSFILMGICVTLPAVSEAVSVKNVVGRYQIEGRASSRFMLKKALEDAFANAVTNFIFKVVEPEEVKNKVNVINDMFRKNAEQYVDSYVVKKQLKRPDTYSVIVDLELNESNILKDLAKAGLIKTLDYIPSYSVQLKCEATEQICRDFLMAVTSGVGKDVARYANSPEEADFNLSFDLKILQVKSEKPTFYHYLKSYLEVKVLSKSGNLGTFHHEFFAVGKTFAKALRSLLDKMISFVAHSVMKYSVEAWKKEYFRLTEYTFLLEKTFNTDRAMDFIYELNKYPGYIKNPHISSITPSGIAISFTGGTLTEAIIEKMKSGTFGPFKVDLISRSGSNLRITIY